jgi:hypothetical protein
VSQFAASVDLEPGMAGHRLEQINALLFYQLAQFVVWGRVHRDLAVVHPDLALLLETATVALSRGGILDHSASCVPPQSQATNFLLDSEILVPSTVSRVEAEHEN